MTVTMWRAPIRYDVREQSGGWGVRVIDVIRLLLDGTANSRSDFCRTCAEPAECAQAA